MIGRKKDKNPEKENYKSDKNQFKETKKILENIINKNLVERDEDKTHIFRAGGSMYANVWARDIFYSSHILSKNKEWRKGIMDTLVLLLSFQNPDGSFPKILDTMNPDLRVTDACLRQTYLAKLFRVKQKTHSLDGYWKDDWLTLDRIVQSEAIDTGLLIINALLDISTYPEYKDKLNYYEDHVRSALEYYQKLLDEDTKLIKQTRFSDWQDSLSRHGVVLVTNLLYWKVVKGLSERGILQKLPETLSECLDYQEIKINIQGTFYDKTMGVYKSEQDKKYFSLSDNLFMIEWKFLNEDDSINNETFYQNIKEMNWWPSTSWPGPPTIPKYPTYSKAPQVIIANIPGYHDECCWSWLSALAGKIAYDMDDEEEGNRISDLIEKVVIRDKTVYDAYSYVPNKLPVVAKSYLFKSEFDWTWGTSYMLEMLETKKKYLESSKSFNKRFLSIW